MGEYIELIGQLKPKNNQSFPIADVNDLKGGYIQLQTIKERNALLKTNKVKQGMLSYVEETNSIYQFQHGKWIDWVVKGSGGGSINIVETLEDLDSNSLKTPGQLVYVKSIQSLRYYEHENDVWKSFNKIYIQPTPPEDKGGIWIDNSELKDINPTTDIVSNLLKVISILENKVKKLEWAFENQIDFGDFKNNQYNEYNDYENPIELGEDTSEIEGSLIEPTEYKEMLPNGRHLCIKSGTYQEMIKNAKDFLPKELLWVEDRQELWIKDSRTNKLIRIGAQGGEDIPTPSPGPDTETMKQIITETIGSKEKIIGINFGDMKNKEYDYQLRVENGKLKLHDLSLDTPNLNANDQSLVVDDYYNKPYFPINTSNTNSPMIYINSVYTGGKDGDEDYNPCSHNFIELVNLSEAPLNLKGLFLHYTEDDSGLWLTLPLQGLVKPSGTFLIRGSQCSVRNVNTTLLKVDTYDIEWTKNITLHSSQFEKEDYSIWGKDNKIQFADNCSFYLSGAESATEFNDTPLYNTAPYKNKLASKWYIDLLGIGNHEDKPMPNESSSYAFTGRNVLLFRYYNMDFVKQAIKPLSKRSNTAQWTHLDLSKLNPKVNITDYTPKASFENKTIFFNKPLLQEGVPNIVNCSFGQNAHTTRCFNWVSKGYYDEYIWFTKTSGVYTEENKFESFKKGDDRPSTKNWNDPIYDRIRSITTDGTSYTVHKFIKDFPEPDTEQTYYYKVGRPGFWTEEKSFTLRNRQSVIDKGFSFLQVTDQQGFTSEEYETWRLSAEFISNNKEEDNFDFIINTGDATQNGNRINEWIDYFNSGNSLFKTHEQMYTVGNNDLAPLVTTELGRGADVDKMNPINVEFFFTFEHPVEVPRSANGVYIPCVYSFIYGDTYFLSMNSEITDLTRTDIYKEGTLESQSHVYLDQIKTWAEKDINKYGKDPNVKWKIAYTHEAPFTIITADLIRSYAKGEEGTIEIDKSVARNGSHLNTIGDYWFSTFLEDNNVSLCLCGHKHTFSNSRYMRDNVRGEKDTWETMKPTVYDKDYNPSSETYPEWYVNLPEREKNLVTLSNDNSQHYVRYVMSQATGFKMKSNKEMPGQNIPWLMEYYPVTKQTFNPSSNKYSTTINNAQLYPHYIVWNVGKGTEVEKASLSTTSRPRIKGNSYKLALTGNIGSTWAYKYNVPYKYTDLTKLNANGDKNASDNIIIEKL